MIWHWKTLRMGVVTLVLGMLLFSGFAGKSARANEDPVDQSVAREAKASIKRGLNYLQEQQKDNGSWQDQPAITGLVVMAMLRSDREEYGPESEVVGQALDYLREHSQSNGGIYDEFYASYSTSICVMALKEADLPRDQKRIAAARRYLLDAQADESEDISEDDPQYGGWGYEDQPDSEEKHRADMSNTQFALSALRMLEEAWRKEQKKTEVVDEEDDGDLPEGPCRQETQLAYDKAIQYLERCQNDDGGFAYRPNESKAGKSDTGELRSYGSMAYAGMKSLIYARVGRDDPRVKAAYQWITNNWSLDENPGMGQQGLYYYYQAMSKCLDAYGERKLVDAKGNEHVWREELINKLLELQKGDGSWINESGRWMESMPELVTAYSILSLEEALMTDN